MEHTGKQSANVNTVDETGRGLSHSQGPEGGGAWCSQVAVIPQLTYQDNLPGQGPELSRVLKFDSKLSRKQMREKKEMDSLSKSEDIEEKEISSQHLFQQFTLNYYTEKRGEGVL